VDADIDEEKKIGTTLKNNLIDEIESEIAEENL
jgi:hypothetical protein